MTKLREPVTIENTLMRVLGELGIERAAEITGHSESYLRSLTDPDKREQLNVRDLELLDLEYQAKTGGDLPLYQALGRRLQTARCERFVDAAANGRHAVDLARESGEASAALFEAALQSGDPKLIAHALKQAEDVHEVTVAAIATLRDQLIRTRPPDTS